MRLASLRTIAVFLAALFAFAALLLGCGGSGEHSQEIRAWTLTVDGTGAATPLSLPAHLDDQLPHVRSRYTLSTHVDLDAGLQGRDLVFAIPSFQAVATLRVDGVPADPLIVYPFDSYRSAGPLAWHVHLPKDARAVDLALTAEHTWPMSGWIEGMPRLSDSPAGDATFRHVSFALEGGNALAVGTMLSAGFTYLVLFLLDRRRRYAGWFALQALCAAHYPLFLSGLTQVFGRMDANLLAASQPWASLAGLQFTYSALAVERSPDGRVVPLIKAAWWPIPLTACASIFGLVVRDPFLQEKTIAPVTVGTCLVLVTLHLTVLVRIARRIPEKRSVAIMLGVSWLTLFATLGIDGGAFVGEGVYLQGIRIGSWALAFVAMAQSAVLSREHIESLRHADGLNGSLAARLGEIEHLNDALRQRILARAREVRATLLRTAPARAAPCVGEVFLGRYRVESFLGAGGMGRVYAVRSVRDGRRWALKVVGTLPTGEALTRFAREAEHAARVVHPAVVSVVDFDVGDDGLPFFVMDLVEGSSLEGVRDRFGDVAWGLGLLAQVASGLEAIHAQGIVHRDLKPGNVLLTDEMRTARITDFGISCAARKPGDDTTGPASMVTDLGRSRGTGLTRTGLILGTPAYMAPELALGARDATPAADVFSFAVMTFELLAGKRPFAEPAFIAAQHGQRVRPEAKLRDLAPSVPAAVADLVDYALVCDPPLRPAAAAFIEALEGAAARAA
jgi:serine/threonine-protein kinase